MGDFNTQNEENAEQPAERVKYLGAECECCGRRFKLRKWRDGMKCPGCKDGGLFPVAAEGGAVDYYIADRSEGYAKPDIRFAQWVKWAGLISPRQSDEAFVEQNNRLQKGKKNVLIHRIMVEKGWIDEKQAGELLRFMCDERPDQDDHLYAEAVIDSGLAGEDEVQKCIRRQQKMSEKYNEVPPLCQLMLERHVINESKTISLLRKLENTGKGPLVSVKNNLRGNRFPRPGSKKLLRKALAGNKQKVRQFVIIAMMFLVAGGIWFLQSYERPYRFQAVCESCDNINRLRWSSEFPLECPDCGFDAVYPARLCQECDHIFPAKNPYVPIACPQCDSTGVRSLELDDN